MKETRTFNILLIEDDEVDRLLVRTLLSSRAPGQIQLTIAPDLGHGLEALRKGSFDLVLLDHTIPQLTSTQELRLVMAEHNPPPVIIHTGYIDPKMEQAALHLGVREVVAKGDLDPLWSAIERVLEHTGGTIALPSSDGQGKTILVVEDEPSVRRIIRMSLELADYTVLEAADGEAALELMHRQARRVDLVIADLVMPRAGGDRLAQALKRIRPGLPVLLVSGASDHDLRGQLGRTPSEEEVLWKPFTPEQLVTRVSRMLSRVGS
ncbi:MAG TPA: response regulator [Gemmatimonadales bacterium]|nr:response regulator [Gemmatimonadales bacterium]